MRGRERKTKGQLSYGEKLRDPRWQRKRLEVFGDRDWKCFNCGATKKELHLHHNFYLKNMEPWEYDLNQLSVLCAGCHREITEVGKDLREALSFLRGIQATEKVVGLINGLGLTLSSAPCRSIAEAEGIAAAQGTDPMGFPCTAEEVMAARDANGCFSYPSGMHKIFASRKRGSR